MAFRAPLRGLFLLCVVLAAGCAPEVGSERWCDGMREKPKADWTAREAGDYAKHCLLPRGEE